VPVSAFERVKNVPPQGTQFWNRRVIEIAAIDHSDLFHDSPRTSVRLYSECDHCVKMELAKTKLQCCKRAFGGQSLTPKTRNEAVQEFDSRRERMFGWYPNQTQNTGKVASHIESPWSKSVGVPMLLDARHLAQGFLRSEEPGIVFPYAGIAVHFYESVAVLGHEAPERRSLLCAAHHPMLAFNHAKRRSVDQSSQLRTERCSRSWSLCAEAGTRAAAPFPAPLSPPGHPSFATLRTGFS